ncbi:hypothetical protein, partial [Streptomyces sp. SID3343]|uniref:hypothetical protein n=1 Tax=Streptomyces sp. SID3343 TaxID=2690260 RepID=UPI001F3CF4BA
MKTQSRLGPRVLGSLAAGILVVAGSAACDDNDATGVKAGATTSPTGPPSGSRAPGATTTAP